MKNVVIVVAFLFGSYLPIVLFGQTTIQVTGTVKSSQGALQGAEVEFLNLNGEFQSNCVSGPNGKFISENKMQVGRNIKIRITRTGFDPAEVTYKITNTGDAGEFMLKQKMIAISGFVKDSISDLPIAGAEIFFYKEATLIQAKSTNSLGYFDLETGFTYGQKITVRVSKLGYYDKEQSLIVTSEGRNSLQDIVLAQRGDRGLRAYVRVTDKKNGKALSNVTITYFEKKKSTFRDTLTSSKGELFLKLYQPPGTTLDLKISRPNYKTIEDTKILSEDPLRNQFRYELVKDRRTVLGKVLLTTAGTAAVVSGVMYFASNSNYDDYKDFSNPNRESDFNTAENQRTISAVALGVAVTAITGYVIYKINQKNREKALERKRI